MLHITTNPEQGKRWTTRRFWDMRSDSYKKVEKAGGLGGATVPHAYRVSDWGQEVWTQATENGDVPEDYGKWRLLRESSETWEEMVEVAPHTHHLAAVEDLDGETVEEIEAGTGWVVHNIRSLAPFYLDAEEVPPAVVEESDQDAEEIARRGYEDMARLTQYLFSHAAVQDKVGDLPRKNTLTYWGQIHPNSFDPEEELTDEEWHMIEEAAEAAVGVEVVEEGPEEATGHGCARDGCEAHVYPLGELLEKIGGPDGPAWVESLDTEQAYEIWGLKIWLSDRPPPGIEAPDARKTEYVDGGGEFSEMDRTPPGGFDRSAASDAHDLTTKSEFLEWLRQLGRSRIRKNPWFHDAVKQGSESPTCD
jgi:hypothetical protein